MRSSPLRCGIDRSSSSTSGLVRSTASCTSRPSATVPTTVYVARSSSRSPWLTSGWSSAISTDARRCMRVTLALLLPRYERADSGARAGSRYDLESSVGKSRALRHADEPKPFASSRVVGDEAFALVFNTQFDARGRHGHVHVALCHTGVLHDVAERFLRDTIDEQRVIGRRRECAIGARFIGDIDPDA